MSRLTRETFATFTGAFVPGKRKEPRDETADLRLRNGSACRRATRRADHRRQQRAGYAAHAGRRASPPGVPGLGIGIERTGAQPDLLAELVAVAPRCRLSGKRAQEEHGLRGEGARAWG